MAGDLAAAAGAGLLLGIQFNPLASVAGAAIAAGLATAGRTAAAAGVLFGAWLVGDGTRVLVRGADAIAGSGLVSGGEAAQWAVLGLWALAGLAIGYALPAWAGTFVGYRVTHGTGWLAAGAVAATASGALSMLSGSIGS
jgi:hypothetical protein